MCILIKKRESPRKGFCASGKERAMSLPRSFEVIELGLKTYPEALSLQQKYLAERLSGKIKDRLLIVEHPPVITEGRQASSADFFFAPAYYQAKGVEIHK